MQSLQTKHAVLPIVGAIALINAGALAANITPGTYILHNHPDGDAAPPTYGLRLDEIINVTSGHDIFTFSFDAPGAAMYLDYDGTSIHIHGTAFGGLDVGGSYHPTYSSMVEIDFTYSVVGTAPGDDDLIVTTPSGTNSGYIRPLGMPSMQVGLWDFGMGDYTFRFGDEADENGHRGFDGLSGWGWLNHTTPGTHVNASDWLFTATPIPLPSAAGLGLLGIVGLIGRRATRRR